MQGLHLSHEGFIPCFQGHRGGQSFLLHQLLHKQLQFKIINMPLWQILGQPALSSNMSSLATKSGISTTLLFTFRNLLEWLTELRKTFYLRLLVCYKQHKWTARGRCTQGEVQKGPEHRSFRSCGVGEHRHPGPWMCWPIQKLSEPRCLGDFMEVSSHRHDQYWFDLSPSPLPGGWRMGF